MFPSTLFRYTCVAVAAAFGCAAGPARAQDEQPGGGLKIRILSSRSASLESSSGERAKAAQDPGTTGQQAGKQAQKGAAGPGSPLDKFVPKPGGAAGAAPGRPAAGASAAQAAAAKGARTPGVGALKDLESVRAAEAQSAQAAASTASEKLEAKRKQEAARREAKLAAMRGVGTAGQVGVPQSNGTPKAPSPAPAARNASAPHAAVAAKPTPASEQPAATQQPPTNPGLAARFAGSEVVRSGEDYFFEGKLNGRPVRFRIRDQGSGVVIPIRLAQAADVVRNMPRNVSASAEWITPIQNMTFGNRPVPAVMARISMGDADVIDVGNDVLSGFKIVDSNGRYLLVTAPTRDAAHAPDGAAPAGGGASGAAPR